MLFSKHSIRTFECYCKRRICFDYKQGKVAQELSSEQIFFENIKRDLDSKVNLDSSKIISEFINGNKNEKTVLFLFNFWGKKTKKI